MGESISQSRFICQVVCTGIQGISAWLWGVHLPKCVCLPSVVYCIQGISAVSGGPLAKVGSSAKCCVLVFKASMLYLWGVHWPKKVCLTSTSLTSRWGVHWPKKVHLPSTILASRWGGPSAKEGSSAKFELTCCFMLCFTECLFVLHTKDLINVMFKYKLESVRYMGTKKHINMQLPLQIIISWIS